MSTEPMGCALPGCREIIPESADGGPRRLYCSAAHRSAARKQRQMARSSGDEETTGTAAGAAAGAAGAAGIADPAGAGVAPAPEEADTSVAASSAGAVSEDPAGPVHDPEPVAYAAPAAGSGTATT